MTDTIHWGLERARDQSRAGAAYWRRRLGGIPTWAIEDELARRGDAPERDQVVRLPGLTVDPTSGIVSWRGDDYVVGGRQMEVLYCLAQARAAGHRRLKHAAIGQRVFRGFDETEARQNSNVVCHALRRRFPGLLDAARVGFEAAIGLVLDAPTPAVEEVA